MCLSNVYKNNVDDSNLLARNVADIKIENGKVIFTDIMGIRTAFDGELKQIDLTENFIIVG
ncbi:MAG: CooT family nickel-binding protein [Mogibacterium sp.]|nr:CooT family nickel-binding protein [Mogibacterium sp.]MBR2539933.1 CooT family nickel-binding protein [Mogibacterium sp.]